MKIHLCEFELILSHGLTDSTGRHFMYFQIIFVMNITYHISAFHGTRRFITALTCVRHLSLSWASSIQSIYPHPTSWRSILISAHLRLGLPSGLLPSGFPTKTLYTPLSSPIRATYKIKIYRTIIMHVFYMGVKLGR